jgi:hypothetical protein
LLVVQYIWQENYIGAYQNELARERAARQEIIPTVDVYVAERTLKYGEPLEKKFALSLGPKMRSQKEHLLAKAAYILTASASCV